MAASGRSRAPELLSILREADPGDRYPLKEVFWDTNTLDLLPNFTCDDDYLSVTVSTSFKSAPKEVMLDMMNWVLGYINGVHVDTPDLEKWTKSWEFVNPYRETLTMSNLPFVGMDWLKTIFKISKNGFPYKRPLQGGRIHSAMVKIWDRIPDLRDTIRSCTIAYRGFELNLSYYPVASTHLSSRYIVLDPLFMKEAPLRITIYILVHELYRIKNSWLGIDYGVGMELFDIDMGDGHPLFESAVEMAQKGWRFRTWCDEWEMSMYYKNELEIRRSDKELMRTAEDRVPGETEFSAAEVLASARSNYVKGNYLKIEQVVKVEMAWAMSAIYARFIHEHYSGIIFLLDKYDQSYVETLAVMSKAQEITAEEFPLRAFTLYPDLKPIYHKGIVGVQLCVSINKKSKDRSHVVKKIEMKRNYVFFELAGMTLVAKLSCDIEALYHQFDKMNAINWKTPTERVEFTLTESQFDKTLMKEGMYDTVASEDYIRKIYRNKEEIDV
nr:MAG TPA: hypothetical protein [Caudoviricetes sp.]